MRELAGEVDGGGVGVAVLGDVLAAGDDDLVGGAGVPADPDAGFGEVGFGQQGDIGDESPQQPFAVPGEVVGACHSAVMSAVSASSSAREGSGWQRGVGLGQRLFGLGERREALLPAGFEAASDEAVLRFAGVEGPLGPLGFVAGSLHGQLGGPAASSPAVGDLVGGGQGQGDLFGVERLEEPFGHRLVHGGGADRPAGRGGHLVGPPGGALVGGVSARGSSGSTWAARRIRR